MDSKVLRGNLRQEYVDMYVSFYIVHTVAKDLINISW